MKDSASRRERKGRRKRIDLSQSTQRSQRKTDGFLSNRERDRLDKRRLPSGKDGSLAERTETKEGARVVSRRGHRERREADVVFIQSREGPIG